jgi:hypothetical protein
VLVRARDERGAKFPKILASSRAPKALLVVRSGEYMLNIQIVNLTLFSVTIADKLGHGGLMIKVTMRHL